MKMFGRKQKLFAAGMKMFGCKHLYFVAEQKPSAPHRFARTHQRRHSGQGIRQSPTARKTCHPATSAAQAAHSPITAQRVHAPAHKARASSRRPRPFAAESPKPPLSSASRAARARRWIFLGFFRLAISN